MGYWKRNTPDKNSRLRSSCLISLQNSCVTWQVVQPLDGAILHLFGRSPTAQDEQGLCSPWALGSFRGTARRMRRRERAFVSRCGFDNTQEVRWIRNIKEKAKTQFSSVHLCDRRQEVFAYRKRIMVTLTCVMSNINTVQVGWILYCSLHL